MRQSFSEAIKLRDGILYNLEYHQRRIDKTQEAFCQPQINLSEIMSNIPSFATTGLFKCRVVYNNKIESIEYIPYVTQQVKSVKSVIDNNIDYRYKYTDRDRLKKLLSSSECDDIIIIKNGFVTDSFSSNLVFESKNGLFTPDTYLLRGTKRQLLIDKGVIKEQPITENDIFKYDRIFFINAMINLEDNIFIETKLIEHK